VASNRSALLASLLLLPLLLLALSALALAQASEPHPAMVLAHLQLRLSSAAAAGGLLCCKPLALLQRDCWQHVDSSPAPKQRLPDDTWHPIT
jgi:hypothetical protein